MEQLVKHANAINDQLARYGVKFGIYKNGSFQERLFPFDALPRVITAAEFATLEKGLVQRVDALLDSDKPDLADWELIAALEGLFTEL